MEEGFAVKIAKLEATIAYLEKKIEEDGTYLDRKIETSIAHLEKKVDEIEHDLLLRVDHDRNNTKTQFVSVERTMEKKIEDKDIHWIRLLVYGLVSLILVGFSTALINIVMHPNNPGIVKAK